MEEPRKNRRSSIWRVGVLALFVLLVVLAFQLTPLSISDLKPTNIKNFVLQFGSWAPVVFILIYSLRAVILVLPVGVMSLVGGLVFGKWLGTVYILMGATAGSCISFLVARYLGRSFIESFGWLHKGRIKSFDDSVEKHGFKVILFLRLIPLFQYDAVNFGSGLSKMKFRHYLLGTAIGMIPGGFINATLGSSLENIVSVQFFVALGAFALLFLVPTIYKVLKKKRDLKHKTADQ